MLPDRFDELSDACDRLMKDVAEQRDHGSMPWKARELVAGAAHSLKKAAEGLNNARKEYERENWTPRK